MPNPLLQSVGDSLANISAAIAECVRQDGQGATPPAQHFQQCLGNEVRRLRSLGQEGLAGGLEALGPPLSRLMTEGW